MGTALCLSDITESRGKQELSIRQSPQRIKTLREHAMVESAVSSNRIEGVEVSAERARAILFLLFVIRGAYKELESRVGQTEALRGDKRMLVEQAVQATSGMFSLTDVERACPGVSRDMVRHVLEDSAKNGKISCSGRGPAARWRQEGVISK